MLVRIQANFTEVQPLVFKDNDERSGGKGSISIKAKFHSNLASSHLDIFTVHQSVEQIERMTN